MHKRRWTRAAGCAGTQSSRRSKIPRVHHVTYLIFEMRDLRRELLGFRSGHHIDAQRTALPERGPNVNA
jgi:hypothetical protein